MVCSTTQKKLCGNIKCIACFNRSFAPHKRSKEWSDKNQKKPYQVFRRTKQKQIFKCKKCNHEFYANTDEVCRGSWCPYCVNKQLCDDNDCILCFNKSFASHEKSKYWSLKNERLAREMFKNSNVKCLFDCEDCKHEIIQTLSAITTNNKWCGYCAHQKLCENNNCAFCFYNSFASSDKVKYFSKKNNIDPRYVIIGSAKKYLFECDCYHEFMKPLSDITSVNGWCPYCSNKLLCDNLKCIICLNKSFAIDEKSKYWSKKNTKSPRDIFLNTHEKYLFDCECGHEINIQISSVTSVSQPRWCYYCGKKELCDNDDCDMCWFNSFASHKKAKYWSDKNVKTPRQVFLNSVVKYIFNCQKKHEFSMDPHHVNNNRWCPFCKNKTEGKLYQWLINEKYDITYQKRFSWCKKKFCLPFDFYMKVYKILIELDGPHHFRNIANWENYKKTQKNDIFKMKKAIKNGYSIVRLIQEDVWNDLDYWKKIFRKFIKHRRVPKILFISRKNEYDWAKKYI